MGTSYVKWQEADKVGRGSSLTFLTLFFVMDSTANTWSPIDDSSIATRCCDTGQIRAVVTKQLFICACSAREEPIKAPRRGRSGGGHLFRAFSPLLAKLQPPPSLTF